MCKHERLWNHFDCVCYSEGVRAYVESAHVFADRGSEEARRVKENNKARGECM